MALPPFAKIFLDPVALRRLGQLPDDVKDCLNEAFRNIKNRKLYLDSPGGRNYPFVTKACQHIIYVSVEARKNIVVVLDLLQDT